MSRRKKTRGTYGQGTVYEKRPGAWVVSWRVSGRRRYSKAFPSKAAAEAVRAQIAAGHVPAEVKPARPPVSLADLVSRVALGQEGNWPVMRALAIVAAGGRCQRCTYAGDLNVHHSIPRSEGGTHALSNLLVLCPTHHNEIHRERDRERRRKT